MEFQESAFIQRVRSEGGLNHDFVLSLGIKPINSAEIVDWLLWSNLTVLGCRLVEVAFDGIHFSNLEDYGVQKGEKEMMYTWTGR
jgi:hypothetical protein